MTHDCDICGWPATHVSSHWNGKSFDLRWSCESHMEDHDDGLEWNGWLEVYRGTDKSVRR